MLKLGENLQKYCQRIGWTIHRLAKESGVPKSTLHDWTSGRKTLDLTQLKKVASVLKVSVHELAFGTPDPNESPAEEILREIFSGDVRVTLHRIERRRK